MPRGGLRKIEFSTSGFRAVLNDAGVDAAVAAEARKQAAAKEAQTGEPYAVERLAGATSRAAYVAKPQHADDERGGGKLTHEKWMEVVWPKVGGPAWRPNRNQGGGQG